MTEAGKGGLSILPARRMALIAALIGVWLALQIVLVVWWATVIERQARLIASLQARNGLPGDAVTASFRRTSVMLAGESTVFLLLLLAVTLLLAWLYWRESRRARAMQAFFASVTHELRTPLTSIRLQAEAIAEGGRGETLARRLLEDSHRLESEIDRTLELARIEGGGSLAEQAVPLHQWLARALPDAVAAHGDRLNLRSHVSEALPPVLADTGALHIILRNLIDNSVRHSRQSPVAVRLTATQRGVHVVLEYQDNGRGVPQNARLGRLFGRGPGSSGAGVGLYLVRRLMQRMQGRVRFNTAPGDGFRSELWFKVAEE
jgi:signal transduction histidine kinase